MGKIRGDKIKKNIIIIKVVLHKGMEHITRGLKWPFPNPPQELELGER